MRILPQKGIFRFFSFSNIDPKINLQKKQGQVVLEYVLLLSIGLVIGALLMRQLVGSADDPKGIRKAWTCLIESIGSDVPGKPDSLRVNPDCK